MKAASLIATSALNMLVAVAAGAFGAHTLKTVLDADMLTVWQTAVHYQMVHGLALLALGILMQQWNDALLRKSAYAMLSGIVVFSGSLYALALTGVRLLGAITPLGGLAFLLGWALLAWCAYRQRR
ncbi:DUF423 domain-containing protein [Undibacterium oligocarboniphilum]|uniref:DUF423 domain-containing protein n=1 Tax=Undibacterium oligocarboniphilum TaxID=666702 RepID=A0A850QJ17_9BURK|nr:DUF423 domain-containing protein [Undibacterium oligocarboniphilum]MBC3870973.1 DUF423 domain-containing protein [Undibacterium oligocarboniphilum]NVO76404.1 DUF423 domain-containing protein [Undibacterium oligocarboniphilum]